MKSDILNIHFTHLIHRIYDSINNLLESLRQLYVKGVKLFKLQNIFGRFPCKKLRALVPLRIPWDGAGKCILLAKSLP